MRWFAFAVVLLLPLASPTLLRGDDEVARLRRHFETVERELLERDVSHLTPAQLANRARHVRMLREYRDAGVFPHNHDFPGERRPYFVDRHGTLCAMAYLIARSGRLDLVERIAATRNHAYLHELADDPELVAWLEESGLSLEEAARIQPTYSDGGIEPGYARGSAVMLGIEGATIVWNLFADAEGSVSLLSGATGVAAGGFGAFVFGGGISSMDRDNEQLHSLHRKAGAATMLAGAWGIGRWLYARGADDPEPGSAAAEPRLSAGPWVGERGELGVGFSVRF